jgi:hypothetical protein
LKLIKDENGNPLQMDACTYQITVPEHTFMSGSMIIRFNQISENKIYINAGSGVGNASIVVVPNNDTVVLFKEYEVDINSGSYIIIVLPNEGADLNTAFEFQYWVDGE